MAMIVIHFELQDNRFCNALGAKRNHCPCLLRDSFYGYPEDCNLGYNFKVKSYNAEKNEITDSMGVTVAVRPADCIAELGVLRWPCAVDSEEG